MPDAIDFVEDAAIDFEPEIDFQPESQSLHRFLSEPPIEVIPPGSTAMPEAAPKSTIETVELGEFDEVLKAPDEPSFWQRLRNTKLAKGFLGATEIEREGMVQGGGIGVIDIPRHLLKFTSVPPPLAEEVRMMTTPQVEQLERISPAVAGVAEGVRELVLTSPLAPIPIAPKTALAAFGIDFATHLPKAKEAYEAAKQSGDTRQAASIATQTILGGALLVAGGAHQALAPKTSAALKEVVKAEPIPETVPEPAQTAQPLGITPPGSAFVQKVIEYFKPRESEAPPEVQIDTTHKAPRLQPYEQEKAIASNPQSLAGAPILGKLLDPRFGAKEPVDQAIITRAYSTSKGQTFAALWAETQNKSADLFPVEKDTGTIALADGSRNYLSDVIEAEMANPGSQLITEAQRNWIRNEWEPLKNDVEAMLREEGVKEVSLAEGETSEVGSSYFPRPAVGKRTEESPSSVGGAKQIPGAKPFFLKKRLYESEREGATSQQQVIYDPDFISRASKYLSGAYRAVADARLANDQSLGGRTPSERYALLREQHEPALNQLQGDALIEFEAQLREQSAHPIWLKEAQVNVGPAFTGKIFPIEIAQKLQKAYGESSHDWVRKAQTVTDAAKAMKLTADMSAPFTQGLAMMFRHPASWAKSTAKSYLSLFRDDVVAKVLEKPENLQAAQEFTQSGGSFLRLQDFMAGAEEGKFATRIPILGKVIERTGRAYGTFLDLAKLEMWKAWKEKAPKEQWPVIAESIENSLFMGRMEQIGLNPGRALGERLFFMAPAYYRGAGGLVSTAFQRDVSGKMTRQMLASYASGVTLTAVASYVALGLSEDEIERRLDPRSGKFLKIPVMSGDGRNVEVGLGNVLSGVVRLMGESIEYHGSDKPIDTGVEQNPYLRFLRAKSAFLPALGIDAATGRDYFGNQLTIKDSLVRAFTPLVLQQLFHNEKASVPQKMEDAMFSFLGLQSFPEDKRGLFVRERERLSGEKFGKPYSELRFPQKAAITRQLEREDRFKRDEATPKQIEAAFARGIERLTTLKKSLTPENQQKLERLAVKIPGYQNTISVNGVTVPLTEKEQERYEVILGEEYNRAIAAMPEMANLASFKRQKVADRRMAVAKQKAKTRLISGR